jgi:hypothetical protein
VYFRKVFFLLGRTHEALRFLPRCVLWRTHEGGPGKVHDCPAHVSEGVTNEFIGSVSVHQKFFSSPSKRQARQAHQSTPPLPIAPSMMSAPPPAHNPSALGMGFVSPQMRGGPQQATLQQSPMQLAQRSPVQQASRVPPPAGIPYQAPPQPPMQEAQRSPVHQASRVPLEDLSGPNVYSYNTVASILGTDSDRRGTSRTSYVNSYPARTSYGGNAHTGGRCFP